MDHTYVSKTSKAAAYKSRKNCSVPQCFNRANDKANISLHKFPENLQLRKEWVTILRMDWKSIPKNAYACSKHFKSSDFYNDLKKKKFLKKNSVPSEKIPKRKYEKSPSLQRKKKASARAERVAKRQVFLNISNIQEMPSCNSDNADETCSTEGESFHGFLPAHNNEENFLLSDIVAGCTDIGVQVDTIFHPMPTSDNLTVIDLIKDDNGMKIATGIPSISSFQLICKLVRKHLVVSSQCPLRKMNLNEKVLLTFMKLKHDTSFSLLAVFFCITPKTAADTFFKLIHALSSVMERFIQMPSLTEIRQNLPVHFKEYDNTRVVIDCTEFKIVSSSCLRCRIRTYSNYKSCHTGKVLLGVSPSGLIIFRSKVYGGRASDKFIFQQCKLLEQVNTGEAIMADRGFLIDDECKTAGIQLYRPPFLKGRAQFTRDEGELTSSIARARVHVERSIQRLKIFNILHGPINFDMLKAIDPIITVCCALVNLSSPILASDKFDI